jgi:hypothetical protein
MEVDQGQNLGCSAKEKKNRSKLGIEKYYIASFGLKLYEYVVELGVSLWSSESEI